MQQTPLFQLNLMLWLTWPVPPVGVVRPLFREAGFHLQAIAPAIALPLEIQARASQANLPLKAKVAPDLLLEQRESRILLPLECKVSSFGPDVSPGDEKHPARQAVALLCASGAYLADYLGLARAADWQAHIVYAVSGSQESRMQGTLRELSRRLEAAHIGVTPAGALGIHVREDGVYLQLAPGARLPVRPLQTAAPEGLRVMEMEADEDPRPLYLLPWDPSIGLADDYERRGLEERVRAAVLAVIGSRLDSARFTVSLEEILQSAVEVWDVWRDHDAAAGLRNAVRAYVRQVLAHLRRMGVDMETHQDLTTLTEVTPTMAQEVRRYLSSAAFRRGEIDLTSEGVQLDFSTLADGW